MKSIFSFKKHPKLSLVFFNLGLLLFIFIVFEITLRILTPDWLKYKMNYLSAGNLKGYGTDGNWSVKLKDGQFYSFTPNSSFKMYHAEYEKTVHINQLGGRCTEVNEKIDTNNIVPFIGDSFTMGVGVEDTETIVAITKRITKKNFLNLGVSGTCIVDQRKIINSRYNELHNPSIVIYGFFLGNDFDEIIKECSKSADTSTAAIKTKTISKPILESGFLWDVNYFINHDNFLNKIYTLQFLKQKLLNIFNKNRKDIRIDPVFQVMNSANEAYLNQVKKILDMEINILSTEPYKSIVVIIPDRYQIYPKIRNDRRAYYNIDEKNINPFLPNQILISFLDKYKIHYIDPTQCLIDHRNEGPLYYTQDSHFTNLGQKTISLCIADTLQKIISKMKSSD